MFDLQCAFMLLRPWLQCFGVSMWYVCLGCVFSPLHMEVPIILTCLLTMCGTSSMLHCSQLAAVGGVASSQVLHQAYQCSTHAVVYMLLLHNTLALGCVRALLCQACLLQQCLCSAVFRYCDSGLAVCCALILPAAPRGQVFAQYSIAMVWICL